ncbi:hypothetical protein MNAN1_003196 [Malassezia nana]|uniref:Uncharacterized protein n=1 Tax=Malassezia nana TaxID=180528 RepID=A0AAF0EPC2_9BASI|nr:hypothetical protein MNAN1_003196 [Malassezia nana]
MSEAFPNPFGPPPDAERPPASEEAPAPDDDLARALRESLAFERDAAERRQQVETAQLQAAIRASEEEHARQQRALEDHQRHVREAIESSRQEAFRDERRREAEAQRHALLEMEVMARSKREHEARMHACSSPQSYSRPFSPTSRESTSDIGSSDLESLLWLRHRGSVTTTESASSAPPMAADTLSQGEMDLPNPFAENLSSAPLPRIERAISPGCVPPATAPVGLPGQEPPSRRPPPPPAHVEPLALSNEIASPTMVPATTAEPRTGPTHTLSRYEALFGRHEEAWDDEPGAMPHSEHGSSISLSPTAESADGTEALTTGLDDATPVRETPPAVPSKADAPGWMAESSTETSHAQAYPPAYVPGYPALRAVQFGAANEPYPVELRAPHGAVLYPSLDLSQGPVLPSDEMQLRFPSVVELGNEQPYFVIRTYSWKVLLQALAWHGATVVHAPGGTLYMYVTFAVPKRSDGPSFVMPSGVSLALSATAEPASLTTSALATACAYHHVPVYTVSLAAHPITLPTDLVTLAQSLFTAPQLSAAPALRELKQVIVRHNEWIDARSHAMESRSHGGDTSETLEMRLLSHQLALLAYPVTAPDAVESEVGHREALRMRMRRTLARWNTSNVGQDEDLATWITPYPEADSVADP